MTGPATIAERFVLSKQRPPPKDGPDGRTDGRTHRPTDDLPPLTQPSRTLVGVDEDQQLASLAETRLELLDTQIAMVKEAATLVRQKGWRVRAAVGCLAMAAALVVAGILTAMGGRLHA